MKGFNDCRCQKCDAKIGWFGELAKPPPCDECGHVSDYSDSERKIAEARRRVLEKLEGEDAAT